MIHLVRVGRQQEKVPGRLKSVSDDHQNTNILRMLSDKCRLDFLDQLYFELSALLHSVATYSLTIEPLLIHVLIHLEQVLFLIVFFRYLLR